METGGEHSRGPRAHATPDAPGPMLAAGGPVPAARLRSSSLGARSRRPWLALELREQGAQLLLHLDHEQPAIGLAERQLDLRLVALALVEQCAARAGDGVAPVVE